MTVFEMHLALNQRIQEVASYKRDKLFPQEIDSLLNKAMFRLLEEGVGSNFQDTQIDLSHVTALLKKNKTSEVILPSLTDPAYQEHIDLVYSAIPSDLYWLINARTEVITDPVNCETAPTLATTTMSEWITSVAFPTPTPAQAIYYANFTITSTIGGSLYTLPTAYLAGFASSNSRYLIIENILETFYRHTTIKVYFERYRDVYYPNQFIIVSPSTLGTVSITAGNVTTTQGSSILNSYTIYNRALISALPSKEVTIANVKNHKANELYSAQKANVFYKTKAIEPSLDQTYDFFTIYREESFLVTRLYYDYIRKPRTINLALNQNCELASSTHPKIVDLAVEILRLDTKDQSYPQTVQDIQLRTN